MKVSLSDLKDQVEGLAHSSRIAKQIRSVELEEGHALDGGEFLRIQFALAPDWMVTDEELDALARTVQDSLILVDERFPSVRFSDAV
jgi:hypothetical protein